MKKRIAIFGLVMLFTMLFAPVVFADCSADPSTWTPEEWDKDTGCCSNPTELNEEANKACIRKTFDTYARIFQWGANIALGLLLIVIFVKAIGKGGTKAAFQEAIENVMYLLLIAGLLAVIGNIAGLLL